MSSRPDAGMPTPTDAGEADGGLVVPASECFELNRAVPNITLPTDFMPTHAAATWLPECTEPTIVLALSEGGCPDGEGHELLFYIEAQALRDGRLLLGENPLGATGLGGLAIRYFRASPDLPAGEWGDCNGSEGTLDIDRLTPDAAGDAALRFDLVLTDCTGSGIAPQRVIGSLTVFLARSAAAACR